MYKSLKGLNDPNKMLQMPFMFWTLLFQFILVNVFAEWALGDCF